MEARHSTVELMLLLKWFELEVMLPCFLHVKQTCYYYTKLEFVRNMVADRDSNPALLDFTQTLSLESLAAFEI